MSHLFHISAEEYTRERIKVCCSYEGPWRTANGISVFYREGEMQRKPKLHTLRREKGMGVKRELGSQLSSCYDKGWKRETQRKREHLMHARASPGQSLTDGEMWGCFAWFCNPLLYDWYASLSLSDIMCIYILAIFLSLHATWDSL